MADRDPGALDLGGGGAAHLAHALLQCVQAVHAAMHVRKAAAIGVERDPRAAGPAGGPGDAGGSIAFGDETAGLGKGLGTGNAEARDEVPFSSPPRKWGSRANGLSPVILGSCFRRNDGWG